ncbi:MAG: NAD(P)/FAD-dependent oxidoreductase [Halocynthiibacter sp.]
MNLLFANDRSGLYPPSYYAKGSDAFTPHPIAQGALCCDVCVIGAGFTGLSSALHLAERGYDVIVVDAQRVGFGASGRNGGQVGQGQRLDQDELEKMLGVDRAKALWTVATQSVDLVKTLARSDMVHASFHDGLIHADHKEKHVSATHDYVRKLREDYGYSQVEPLSRDELSSWVASPIYHGGMIDHHAGHIDPLQLVLGLARLAAHAGVRIFEQSEVLDISDESTPQIRTQNAMISAGKVIVACNGYIGNLLPKVARHVMPINNYIVATKPLEKATQEAIIKGNVAVADSKFVVNYFRFSDDHRLLFGGTESYRYKFPQNIETAVRRPLGEVFPQLSQVKIDYAWGGTLGITRTRMPHFDRVSKNVISMSGFSGHGVAMGTLSGQIAADYIAGQSERFDLFSSIETPAFPGGTRLRTPLLTLAMLWYSLRDKL